MKSLYLRIYITLVLLLAAFAGGSAFLFHRQIEQERGSIEATASDRVVALAELLHKALPAADAPRAEQAQALRDWGQRLRMAVALHDAQGQRIGASEMFERREQEPGMRGLQVTLDDGRSLWLLRGPRQFPNAVGGPAQEAAVPGHFGGPPGSGRTDDGARPPRRIEPGWLPPLLGPRPNGQALVLLLVLLFLAVALSAYPVVRRLTRRLENLKQGVERFGAGRLGERIQDGGRDEVAALASSFNRAADQIEALLRSHQSLLANASHELRSPLARLKMAFAMLDGASPAQQLRLHKEIDTNIGELDALVEEVLLASRLESGGTAPAQDRVEMLALAAEEAARSGVDLELEDGLAECHVLGEDRLLRRALRNLLENARRYGGGEVTLRLARRGLRLELAVCDRGPGVPVAMRERIFEPFFRMPGHAEQAGGVGLGLSLVKQIAARHQGTVRCEAREGGGSCFVLSLPAAG